MTASTIKVWQSQEGARPETSSAWVGVLLFLGSAVVSIKSLGWLAGLAVGLIMQ